MKLWLQENALTILIALIGIIATIVVYIIGKRVKKPIYAIRSTNLIQDFTSRFEKLEIKYADEQIANLTATKVVFWNSGKDTINGGDIAPANPLMIKVKDGYKLLDASVLYTKEDANQFKIIPSQDGAHVLIQFDYLDKGEGGVIQLLHTGKSSDDVEVNGTIKGAGKPNRRMVSIETMRWVFVSLVFASFGVMVAILSIPGVNELSILWKVIVLVTTSGIMYLGFGFYLLKKRVPKGFEIFEKEI